MVAIRRQPAPPPEPASQDSDSSAAASKAKALHSTSHLPKQSSPLINGKSRENSNNVLREDGSRDTGAPPKRKSKEGRKTKNERKKRKNKNANIVDVLLRYLLLFFTIYSLSVCPNDAELKSPICRGLSEYRRLILEPYVFPTVNKALSHPSVLPYVDRAMPYANQVIRIARPVALRTQLEWNRRITPQWNKVIVPQYQKYFTPQLERANAVIQPYISAVEAKYESLLGPHVRMVAGALNKSRRTARPYVLKCADRMYSTYQTARPYLLPIWQRINHTLKQLLIYLRAQRRQFVDPHVARIWERVLELSRGDDETLTAQSPLAHSDSLAAAEKPADFLVLQGLSAGLEFTASPADPPASSSPVSSPPSESPTISIPVSQPLQSVSVTEDAALEAFPSTSSSLLESASVTASVEETTLSPTTPTSTPSILPSPSNDDDGGKGVDLEAFYKDIEFSEEPEKEEQEEDDVQDGENPSLSEEELEELRLKELAKTAEKRRDITSRHTKWEEKLENVIKEKKKTLRKALVALRKAAVQDLKTNTAVQSAVQQLEENAEKFLKGAEAYLSNIKTQSRTTDEKVALWTKFISKVDAKFTEHLHHTEDVVNGWYTAHLEEELQEVRKVAEEVRDVADKAQVDVGYDYIWLADVTYLDWQRYHDLVGKSNKFAELANSIQNGSHPSPPVNPIRDAMHELQLEVQDVITGFETRFRRIKRNSSKTLDFLPEDTVDEEETEQDIQASSSPDASVKSNLVTPVSGSESSMAGILDISILPIPADGTNPTIPLVENELPVVGRGRAEVEEAFERAEAVLDRGHLQDFVRSTPDETSAGLVTSAVVLPSVSSLHEEL